jgi:MFS family permease
MVMSQQRANRGPIAFLLLAVMVEMVFFIVLGPLLPHYASEFHLSKLGAGVLSASYSVGCGVAAVPAGMLAGAVGARATVIGGLFLVGLACAGFALGTSAVALDAARTVQGVGAAALWAGAIGWLIELGGGSNRGRLIGIAFSAAGIGACLGPAVGALATLVGPRTLFLALAAVIVALGVAGIVLARRHPGQAPGRSPLQLGPALASPGTRRALAIVALPSLGFGVAGVLVPLRLHGLGAPTGAIAAAYIVASLLESGASPVVGHWYDRRGGGPVLRATLTASVACVVVLALDPGEVPLLVALAVSWPVIGSVWVPALAELTASVERVGGESGLALGLFNLCWAVNQSVGALAGAVLARASDAVPYLILAALFALAAVRYTSRYATDPAASRIG